MRHGLLLPVLCFTLVPACSSTESNPVSTGGADAAVPVADGGTGDDATSPAKPDSGTDAGSTKVQEEAEPNDGKTVADVGTMTVPGQMTGTLSPADDVDIFSISVNAGELWDWSLTPASGDLAPHLTVFDTASDTKNPTRLVAGSAGKPSALTHFVLQSGSFVAAVRDTRNVPKGTGKGGATFGYTLEAKKLALAPTSATLPGTKTGKLGGLGALDLYTFDGKAGTGFDIVLRAARKTPASTLDSRMSLFDKTAGQVLITNDDAAGTSDSQVGGTLPSTGAYIVVVESEGTNASDLSYELEFKLR
jgi:hypothetical protein